MDLPGSHDATASFLDFTYHPAEGLRHRADGMVHLAPKSVALLQLFLAQRGELVSKQELMDALWPAGSASEYAMSRTVRRLREALGDDARNPRYLKTEHGRGFRWIAPTSSDDAGHAAAPQAAAVPALIGRARELRTLDEAWGKAQAGSPGLVVVEGPSGAGKTSLVDAFLNALPQAVPVVRGRCLELRTMPEPYGPFLDALDGLVRTGDGDALGLLRRFAPTWLAQMPWLDPETAASTVLTESSGARMIRELGRFIEELVVIPHVLVLEDLHWADPATIDAIVALAHRVERGHLLVLATRRARSSIATEPTLDATVAALERAGRCRRLELSELDIDAVAALVVKRLGLERELGQSSAALDDETIELLVRGIVGWTGGNPLFVTTVVDHLVRTGAVSVSNGGGVEVSAAAFDAELPPSLVELLDAEFSTLARADRDLLDAASVLGDRFSAPTLSEITGSGAVDVERRCAELSRCTPIVEPVGDAFAFTHSSYRHALHTTMGAARRSDLHRNAAEALLARANHEPAADAAVAEHLLRADDPDRAAAHLTRAGWDARRRHAPRQALTFFEAAVDAMARMRRGVPAIFEAETRIGLALAQLTLRSSQSAETLENLDRIDELVQPLASSSTNLRLWQNALLVNNLAGRTHRVRAMAPTLLAMAEARSRLEELMDAHHAMGEAALHGGSTETALRHFDRSADLLAESIATGSAATRAHILWQRDSGARIQSAIAGAALLAGQRARVQPAIDRSFDLIADGPNSPLAVVGNYTIGAAALHLAGLDVAAGGAVDRARGVAEDENAEFLGVIAAHDLATGRVSSISEAERVGDVLLDKPAIPFPLGPLLLLDAWAERLATDATTAAAGLEFVDRLATVTSQRQTRWIDAEIARVRGVLLLAIDPVDRRADAIAHLERAVSVARDQRSRHFEKRATQTLAAVS